MSVFVCDGYDKKGKIEAAPGLWPEFTFVYRPALPEEVYRLGSNPRSGEDFQVPRRAYEVVGCRRPRSHGRPTEESVPRHRRTTHHVRDRLHCNRLGGGPKKLAYGVRLILAHPEVADRSCSDCAKYDYDQRGEKVKRFGLPVLRPAGMPTPCFQCPKNVKGRAYALSKKNHKAYRFYKECKATGQFPDDPIVRQCAAIIAEIEDSYYRDETWLRLEAIAAGLGSRITK